MCGIAGFSGTFDPQILQRFSVALRHRGPDDSGVWHSPENRIGLSHCRLSIIDLSPLGHQPMTDASGQIVVVFNGEVYNFRELRREMEGEGFSFRGDSDTEVLLALYRARGEAMLPLLNGIFALAIYDRADDALFLACDEMAVKPLYFSERPDGFVFASELKALLSVPGLVAKIDVTTLFRTLGFLWSPGGTTPLEGVRRVSPGEALRVKAGRVVRRWKWSPPSWTGHPLEMSTDHALHSVREALCTAVHRQMVADVPVGAFLSGGLDSSAVVAIAREVTPAIDCFTIDTVGGGDAGATDDLPYARRVAKHLGVALHEIQVSSSHMATDWERMVFQLDEPLADPAPLNVLYISQLARQHGVKVLLSGAGGDDLFAGYRRHRALTLERCWAWLPASARANIRRATASLDQRASWSRRVAKSFAHADLTAEGRLMGYFLWGDAERLCDLFAPEHRPSLSRQSLVAPLQDYLATLPTGLPPLHRMLALEQRFFLADHNLLYTDKMSMAAGVEVRVPFLDHDLVRLANAIPVRFKQRAGEGKWILKRAMEQYLPHDVIYRPKTGFGAPLRRWLRHELKDLVDDTLSPDTLRKRGLFDAAAVTRLVDDDRAGRVDAAHIILGLMSIEVWCRHFLEFRHIKATAPVGCRTELTV